MTEKLEIVEFGIKVFKETDLNEQWAVTQQEIMKMPACYEEILEEKKRTCLAIFQHLISPAPVHGLVYHHLDC